MRYIARRCNTRGACAALRVVATRTVRRCDCATRACLPFHSVAKLYLPLMLSMLEIVRRMIWAVFRWVTRVEYPEYDHALVVRGRTECAGAKRGCRAAWHWSDRPTRRIL